jgi:hypothetical protein
MQRIAAIHRIEGVSMEHTAGNNAFSILFIVTFFASIATVVLQFG